MDTITNQQSQLSPWARSIEVAIQRDGREQPWKAALETERKAKEEGTYDQIVDVSQDIPSIGDDGDNGSIRACNF